MEGEWGGYDHQTDRGEGRMCPNGLCVSLGRAGRVGGGEPGGMGGMEGVWRGYRGGTTIKLTAGRAGRVPTVCV